MIYSCEMVVLRGRHGTPGVWIRLCFALLVTSSFILIFKAIFKENDVVDGWKKLENRYATDFFSPNEYSSLSVVNNPCARPKPPTVLMIVTSAVGNVERREAIRETWAKRTESYGGNASVLFLVGRSEFADLDSKVTEENDKYKDVIVEDFVDTYYNLTVKSIMLLRWVEHNCGNATFIMKMDDDVYLNVDNLMKFLKEDHVSSENFLVGKLYHGLPPDRRITSKWYVPEHIYSSPTYPDFLCGVGFLMSRDVARRLYQESLRVKLFFLEDMFITGTCAENARIKRRNHVGFHFFEHVVKVECNSVHSQMILLSHYTNSKNMRKTHREITQCT